MEAKAGKPAQATVSPLAGIKVLDFTHVLAGPFCSRLLADFGADVVRVESTKHPDRWGKGIVKPGFESRQDRQASYLNTNRTKRSICIDIKNIAGRALAARLASVASCILENPRWRRRSFSRSSSTYSRIRFAPGSMFDRRRKSIHGSCFP